METKEENIDTDACLNCEAPIASEALYCSVCGQKNGTGKVTLLALLKEFFSNFFNLDSKTIRTALALFIPGKLTEEYFLGKHKSYSHPMRLFFIAAVFFFALLSWNFFDEEAKMSGAVEKMRERITYAKNLALVDSLKEVVELEFPQPEAKAALDSLRQKMNEINKLDSISLDSDVFDLSIDFFKIKNDSIYFNDRLIAQEDFINLSPSDLVSKYGSELTFFQKILARQTLKIARDGNSMLEYMVANFPLMVLLMMPFLALFLKILFFRRQRYYVEHLFFSFHFHAFVFLWGSLLIALENVLPSGLTNMLTLCIFVYLFMAMKKVYGQSWGKTILKFIILFLGYTILSFVFMLITLAVSFILF